MKTDLKIKHYCVISLLALLFIIIFTFNHNNGYYSGKSELYPGQNTVLALDDAHKYVRDNIADKSYFSVNSRYFVDVKLYDNPEKKGEPLNRVRKLLFGVGGGATVISNGKGYLITAKHVINPEGALALMEKTKVTLEKKSPGMYVDMTLVPEYTLTNRDGDTFLASVVALGDEELGMLRVNKYKNFNAPGVVLSDADSSALSDKAVVMIGGPLGVHNAIMDGRIARSEDVKTEEGKFMYVIAPIVPGNSGGPVITLDDMKLVGVVSQVMVEPGSGTLVSIGLFVPNSVINKYVKKVVH